MSATQTLPTAPTDAIAGRPSVLVVGAGPVGLALACELIIGGAEVTVISKDRRVGPHSRATILWPRILELLDRIGVAETLVAHGHYFDQMNYYSEKKRIGLIRFDRLPAVGYPFAITIPQWKTESILESHLTALGGTVLYGRELVDGAQTANMVTARISHDGHTSAERFDWVVGSDGYASSVRARFGFDFAGHALETKLAITDAELIGEHTTSEAAYYLTRHGNMVLAPLGDGIFRVGASVPAGTSGPVPDREFFETLLKQRVPGRKRLGQMNFSGVFTANIRTASTFRRGRVFLAGDAAHAMSPSGAQGLNTGLQDAVNLGWKLAGVARGDYPPELLDSYDTERRPAVAAVSGLSTQLAHISLYSSRPKIAIRDTLYRLGSATGTLESMLAPKLAQIDTHYGRRPRSKSALIRGQRLPLGWRHTPTAPVLAVDRHTILLWPGHSYHHAEWCALTEAVRAARPDTTVHDLGGNPAGGLTPYLTEAPHVIVARPDGHVEDTFALPADATAAVTAICAALYPPLSTKRNTLPGTATSLSATA
ncbi:FAD-dependent monooxygenase [Rhodococcus sp. 1168]|uniref:FAD-dependent monooxygenase n=1 Tax=Rhodococcus sp. 1168 TaxID=2018041 RepID=UPI000A0D3221|nr:FAD-dependent monooxygenase [Rhodococcus sp. 1168]ORI17275.1 hypothetical protein BJI47_13610 [Rhodococcus sp. 1168]